MVPWRGRDFLTPGSNRCAGHAIRTAEGASLLSRDRSVVHFAMSSTSPIGRVASDAAMPCLLCPDRLPSCASISANPAPIPASATKRHQPKRRSPIACGIPALRTDGGPPKDRILQQRCGGASWQTHLRLQAETHAVVREAHLRMLRYLVPQIFVRDRISVVQRQMG